MDVEIRRSIISGQAEAPASPAMAHRIILISSMAPGQTVIKGLPLSPQIDATISACQCFGADIVKEGDTADVFGPVELKLAKRYVECHDSNTTLKLFLPFASSFDYEVRINGSERLSKKNLAPFFGFLDSCNVKTEYYGTLPAALKGPLSLKESLYPAKLGSQFLCGVILCAPLLEDEISIGIEGTIFKNEYVFQTMRLMEECGIQFYEIGEEFISMPADQAYLPPSPIRVPSSPYLSAFALLAGALSGKATLRGIADWQKVRDFFSDFDIEALASEDAITVFAGSPPSNEIDVLDVRSFLLHSIVLASTGKGTTRLFNLHLLPSSELNRAKTLCYELGKMGAKIKREANSFLIEGAPLSGAKISPNNDPSIAMACSAAALCASGTTTIRNAECVESTFPGFFKTLVSLGALIRSV